jgi:hypothetical protein
MGRLPPLEDGGERHTLAVKPHGGCKASSHDGDPKCSSGQTRRRQISLENEREVENKKKK